MEKNGIKQYVPLYTKLNMLNIMCHATSIKLFHTKYIGDNSMGGHYFVTHNV
jgi:hypothetical protein